MPIVKTQGGKVVTKDGKVSCECCGGKCVHTANFVDPTKWDPLTGSGMSAGAQKEINSAQFALLFAGGHLVFDAQGSASNGTSSFAMSRTIEADFLANSCKQGGLNFTETNFSLTGSPVISVFTAKVLQARFSIYNQDGTTAGKLYPIGLYFQFFQRFSVAFQAGGTARYQIEHTANATSTYLPFIVGSDTLQLPFENSVFSSFISSGSTSLTFTPSAP